MFLVFHVMPCKWTRHSADQLVQISCSNTHCVSMLQVLLNSLEDSIMLCEYCMQRNTWIIRFVNQPWIRLTGTNVPLALLAVCRVMLPCVR